MSDKELFDMLNVYVAVIASMFTTVFVVFVWAWAVEVVDEMRHRRIARRFHEQPTRLDAAHLPREPNRGRTLKDDLEEYDETRKPC
jgi:hypothetical protein